MTAKRAIRKPVREDLAGRNVQVEEAARRLLAAKGRLDSGGMNATAVMTTIAQRDAAWHDLTLALGEPCDCEEGTCPGYIGA